MSEIIFNTNEHEVTTQEEFDKDINRMLRKVVMDRILSKYTSGLTRLKWVACNEPLKSGDTACTDGYTVWVYLPYWNIGSDPQKIGLMFHEMLHPLWLHFDRFKHAIHFLANMATDLVINRHLRELSRVSPNILLPANPPEGKILDSVEYGRKAEEIIYNELARAWDDEKNSGDKDGDGDGDGDAEGESDADGTGDASGQKSKGKSSVPKKLGPISDWEDFTGPGGFKAPEPGASGEEEDENTSPEDMVRNLRRQWEKTAKKIAQIARNSGDFPSNLIEELDREPPGINLAQIIQNFVQACASPDVSETHFDRRHLADDLYIEDISVPAVSDIIAAKDTSGSMYSKWLSMSCTALEQAVQTIKVKRLWVLDIDAALDGIIQEYNPGDKIDFTAKGRGGTDFRPPFEWAKTECPTTPKLLLYFTDGYGPFPEEAPPYPTVFFTFGLDPSEYPKWSRVVDMRPFI